MDSPSPDRKLKGSYLLSLSLTRVEFTCGEVSERVVSLVSAAQRCPAD